MAIICLACFPKRSVNLFFTRLLQRAYSEQKVLQPLPPKSLSKDAPIKFTTNKASSLKITETTGLVQTKFKRLNIHVMFISTAVLLVYFCLLREESDIDEMLKGDVVTDNEKVLLLNLKLKLSYCEKNNLPTAQIKAKIKELEDKEVKTSPFRK